MNKVSYISMVDDKINELKSQIAAMKTNETLSKNTRGTQLYQLGRTRRTLHLIHSLLEQLGDKVKLDDADRETLILITSLAEERAERTSIVVNEGDSLLELLQKYDGKKDLQKKLTAACEKAGLAIDYKTGLIVKK